MGRVVRAERPARRREADLREPLRRGGEPLAARGPGSRLGHPVAEHQHRQGGREPVGRRRRRGGRQRPRAVGRVGRGGRQRQRLRQPRPDLRLQGRQAGGAQAGLQGLQAVRGGFGGGVLLAAGRPRPARRRTAARPTRATRRSTSTRAATASSPTSRSRARATPSPGCMWYEKDPSNIGLRNNEQVFAARIVADPKADGGFSWRAVGSGTTGQNNIARHDRRERLRQLRRLDRGRGRLLAQQGRHERRRGPARRGGHAHPGRARPCRGPRSRRTSAAAGTGSSSRAWSAATTSSCSTAATPSPPPIRTPASPTSRSSGTRCTSRGRRSTATRPAGSSGTSTPRARSSSTRRAASVSANGHGHGHGRASLIDARVPVSSSCTADPFTKDGASCTAGDLNAPFFTFTTAGIAAAAVRTGRDRRSQLRDLRRVHGSHVKIKHHKARDHRPAPAPPARRHPRAARDGQAPPQDRRARPARQATARATCACAGTCASTASRCTRAATA